MIRRLPSSRTLHSFICAPVRIIAVWLLKSRTRRAARPVYEQSLEYFDRAAKINEQIGVNDPAPYLSISRTYSQLGEFFIAAKNVQKGIGSMNRPMPIFMANWELFTSVRVTMRVPLIR